MIDQLHVNPGIFHLTHVHIGSRSGPCRTGQIRVEEQVLTGLDIIVKIKLKFTIEQHSVETHVGGDVGLPLGIDISDTRGAEAL